MSTISNLKKIEQQAKELCIEDIKSVKSISDIYDLVVKFMIFFGGYKSLPGSTKKKLVINIISEVINETNLKEKTPEIIDFFIDKSLPVIIDLLVDASKNKWNFKEIEKKYKFPFCC